MDVIQVSSYPLLRHYGDLYHKMTAEQAEAASFDERFASIGRFVVGRAIKFYSSVLSCEGKIAYDPEDVFLELWADLKIRNNKYSAERGEYVTFARRIIRNKLSELIETVHCVQLPANASEKYKDLIARHTLDKRQTKRLAALVAASVDHFSIKAGDGGKCKSFQPDEIASSDERRNMLDGTIQRLLSTLSARESIAIGFAFGLWSRERITMDAADLQLGLAPGTMAHSLLTAKKKMRKLCSSLFLGLSWL